jgi:seryl-tRNA synthetase
MLQIAFIRESGKSNHRFSKEKHRCYKCCPRGDSTRWKRRATQVELDNILAESNKLSKDIGELMKGGEKAGRNSKEKQF